MHKLTKTRLGQHVTCLAFALLALNSVAHAQDPEAGDTVPPEKRVDGRARVRVDADAAAPRPRRYERRYADDRPPADRPPAAYVTPSGRIVRNDHDTVVGRFGVGFFGVVSLPIMGCAVGVTCAPDIDRVLPAPSIGARYWWREDMALEGAVGLYFLSGESPPGVDVSAFGFALHAGVPFALLSAGHFVFEVVPQLNIGLATGSYETAAPGAVNIDVSGFLLELGGKAGAEIHFGFIGIPQLSLQGTIGLMLRHESRSAEVTGVAGTLEQSATTLSTGVDGAPWAAFTGALTAIYYY